MRIHGGHFGCPRSGGSMEPQASCKKTEESNVFITLSPQGKKKGFRYMNSCVKIAPFRAI